MYNNVDKDDCIVISHDPSWRIFNALRKAYQPTLVGFSKGFNMASPQTENGYTKIANEILEQLVKAGLLGSEWDIAVFIIRQTYGFHKKSDWISLTQFQEATNKSRMTVVKTLKNLLSKKILIKNDNKYGFNKDYDSWVVKPLILVKSPNRFGIPAYTKTGIPGYTHKRNKRYITKERAKTNLLKLKELKTQTPLKSICYIKGLDKGKE